MRKRILQSSARPSSAAARVRCTARAQLTAQVAASNTASTESPAMSITRPSRPSIDSRKTARAWSSAATVPVSSQPIKRE